MTWLEVRDLWHQAEDGVWYPLYTDRGFPDWWSWRSTYVSDLELDRRAWSRETIAHPLAEIPRWFVGGYRAWKKYLPAGAEFGTFGEIATHPELTHNEKVMAVVAHMGPTRFIALRCGSEIAVLDGTHRAVATAMLAAQGAKTVPSAEILAAEVELEVFDRFRRGRPLIRIS